MIGVLIINLGTPDAPTPAAVRRYLNQFLSDRRVVEIPPIVWQPILKLAVLTTRPAKSARAYAEIWSEKGSPLGAITRAQADDLQRRLGEGVRVDHAMRYGQPAIETRLKALTAAGCDRILIAPLYPQYCGATTATVFDEVARTLTTMRTQPAIRILPPYYADSAYIGALAQSLWVGLETLAFTPERLIASFHGMPERTRTLGDPYHDQCQTTATLLEAALGMPLTVAFQSRFGRARWLEPATEETLIALARQGVRKVAVFAPGFAVDCLETLEELAMRGRDAFLDAGGSDFAYLPCLNDGTPGMAMLETLVLRELEGWRQPA